jgi:hypothetical protein
MDTWRTGAVYLVGALALVLAASGAACGGGSAASNNAGSGDDGGTGDDSSILGNQPNLQSITVEPPTASLESLNSAPVAQAFTATAHFADGTTAPIRATCRPRPRRS